MKVKIKNSTLIFQNQSIENALCGSGISGYIYPNTGVEKVTINDLPPEKFQVILDTTSEEYNGSWSYTFNKNNTFDFANKKIVLKVEGLDFEYGMFFLAEKYNSAGDATSSIEFRIMSDGIYSSIASSNDESIKLHYIKQNTQAGNVEHDFTGIHRLSVKLYIVDKDIVIK